MEDEDGPMTPFWLQSTTSLRQRRRRSSADFFLNSTFLIIILLVSAILFIFFIIPSLLSLTSQIFKPNAVKKSWDSLNLVLVLFALVCGFLSRTYNDNTASHESSSQEVQRSSNPSTPRQWYDYSDRTAYNSMGRLRSSSSYPDLRQESPWMPSADDRWRFFDDTQVSNHRFSDSDDLHRRSRRREVDYSDTKNMAVDAFVGNPPEEVSYNPPPPHRSPPPPSPPPPLTPTPAEAAPPPPPPPTTVKRRAKRTAQALGHKEKSENNDLEHNKSPPPPLTPTPEEAAPPPPPPPATVKRRAKRTAQALGHKEKSENNDVEHKRSDRSPQIAATPPPAPPLPVSEHWEQKEGKSDRKRGGATKDFLTSLYHQTKKKKKQRQRSVENFKSILQPPPSNSLHLQPPPSPPPPPPPTPPPPSVFHNLFSSKKGKTKKIHSDPPTPPPPPPLISTARVSHTTTTQNALDLQSHTNAVIARKPPLPVKTRSFNSVEDNTNSGSESPMNSIPPPPPPPPFKMPEWKFVVQGDFVRIKSNSSSRSGSPDLDDVGPSSSQSASATAAMDGGDSTPPPMFCASPDVNTKADSFIASFRAGLKLEKINSIKQKQGTMGMSNLGPERSPSPDTTLGPSSSTGQI